MHEVREDSLRRDLDDLRRDQDPVFDTLNRGGQSALEVHAANRAVARRSIRKNPLGVRHLIGTIDEAMEVIERIGQLTPSLEGRLEQEFGGGRTELYGRFRAIFIQWDEDEETEPEDGAESLNGEPDDAGEKEDEDADQWSDKERTAVLHVLQDTRDEQTRRTAQRSSDTRLCMSDNSTGP